MSTTFQANDGFIWHWDGLEWTAVCSEIEPSRVYTDPSRRFFALEIFHAGAAFRIDAGVLFHRETEDAFRALIAGGIEVKDRKLTIAFLRENLPVSRAIVDPAVPQDSCRNFENGAFRLAWQVTRAKAREYV